MSRLQKRGSTTSSLILFLLIAISMGTAATDPVAANANPAQSALVLDEAKIHQAYEEGNFEIAISLIESFTKANPRHSKSDSIFIAKHLSVIYAANPDTREKGKSYMFRLLDLVPSANIVDMFVSDEIDRIFQRIREEYIVRQKKLGKPSPTQLESNQYAIQQLTKAQNPGNDSLETTPKTSSQPQSVPPASQTKTKISPKVLWITGGVALATVTGVTVWALAVSPSKNSDVQEKTYVIPH